MLRFLKLFAENAAVNLLSGVILFGTALVEIVRNLEDAGLGAHHGVALFGLIQVMRYLPHFVHGAEQVTKSHGG